MKTPLRSLGLVAALLVVGLTGLQAAPTLAEPEGAVMQDAASGLSWQRCSVGQRWQAPLCVGQASLLTWQQAQDQARALSAELSDTATPWRLPTLRELLTLVDRSGADPAMDAATFPNTPSTYVWSATPNAQRAGQLWHVHFGHGGVFEDGDPTQAKAVRLVRGSTPPALADARPSSDYMDNGDGTVTHRPSGLIWQRCPVGQSWQGGACTGSPSTLSWQGAITQYGARAQAANRTGKAASPANTESTTATGWRLPSQDELLTLVDYTQPGRAINAEVFPSTSNKAFWSATPHVNAPQHGWYVVFAYDCAYYRYYQGSNAVVRLVRSGR